MNKVGNIEKVNGAIGELEELVGSVITEEVIDIIGDIAPVEQFLGTLGHEENIIGELALGGKTVSTNDYEELINLPKLNNTTLKGNKYVADTPLSNLELENLLN